MTARIPIARAAIIHAALVISCVSHALIRVDGMLDSDALNLGAQHPFVGRIEFTPPSDYRSCVLIADKWILTAGHNLPSGSAPRDVKFGNETRTVVQWFRNAGYNSADPTNGLDLMLGRLNQRVTSVPVARIYRQPDERGRIGTIAGYGAGGFPTAYTYDWKLRGGTNLIEGNYAKNQLNVLVDQWPKCLVTDFDNSSTANNALNSSRSPFWNIWATSMESNIAPGDSGGGLFINIGGVAYTAGITSARFRFDSGTNYNLYGTANLFMRISSSKDWIDTTALEAGGVAGEVQYNDFLGDITKHPLTVELRNVGSITPLETQTVVPNIAGTYSFTTALRGTYDVAFKASHWLRSVSTVNINETGISTVNVSLRNGDVNGSNDVDLFDYLLMSDAFDTSVGDTKFSTSADLNGDNMVDFFDYLVFSESYEISGAP